MFAKRTDLNYFTARRLGDMAESLGKLARAFDEETSRTGRLTREDGLAAMEASAALVCKSCGQCGIYEDSAREDSYYLYYLLRSFEQNGQVAEGDMPRPFQSACPRKEAYLAQLNRSLGRATMNLSWKNRFLESRDAVISQFRELSVILEEFSHQIDQARDISEMYGAQIRRAFKKHHMAVDNLLLLEYENGQREAYLTVKTLGGRCVTARDAARLIGGTVSGDFWSPAKDSRSIIGRQYATLRFVEEGSYQVIYGASRTPKQGERYSGDNYTFCESPGSQMIMSLSDGMGSGEEACRESGQVVDLTQQLLETGFSPRSALKLVNSVLLLSGAQHPATLDLSCVDLHTAVLEIMKLGAAPTFIIGQEGAECLEAGQVPMGMLQDVEPVLISRKLWEGDRIVMVTDGVLDALPGDDKAEAMRQFLEGAEEMPPQELAEKILDFAVSCIPAPRDDMTVLTAEIWKRRE